jgi:Mg-chelatase subunit ChlI
MGKKAKEHKKKVEKRKRIMQQEMKHFQKVQQQLLEKIMSEQQSTQNVIGSALDQIPNLDGPMISNTDNQILNSTILNGPQI